MEKNTLTEKTNVKKCNKKTEIYCRVCGFFRPVANYNNGKIQEFNDRNNYNN